MNRYLIVDDEHIAHDIIKGYCDLLPNFKLEMNCYDALEAIEYLSKHDVDLMFLDLNMPKLSGFDFLKTLPSPPKVIVTTAYKEHAIEGYELNVVDYLLKPFSFQRFLKAINKAVVTPHVTPTTNKSSQEPNSIFLHSSKKYIQIVIDDILFLEASGNYTKVMTINKVVTVREKISELIDTLSSDDFFQVHKSFAIAKKHIDYIEGNRIIIREHFIPIGSTYRLNVTKLLNPKK